MKKKRLETSGLEETDFLSTGIGLYRPIGLIVTDIAIGARGLGFNFQACQVGHSVANRSSPLRRFCVVQALSSGDGPRHSFRCNTASIVKI